jgi:hypothetical protein
MYEIINYCNSENVSSKSILRLLGIKEYENTCL